MGNYHFDGVKTCNLEMQGTGWVINTEQLTFNE